MEINFRECYQIKYFVVPNFREIAKKLEVVKLCFVKVSYFKVVEKSSGEKPFSLGNSSDTSQDEISQITYTHFFQNVFLLNAISYSSNHVLNPLIENRKKPLDQKKIVGAVIMGLLKAFDSKPGDVLIAKIYVHGF